MLIDKIVEPFTVEEKAFAAENFKLVYKTFAVACEKNKIHAAAEFTYDELFSLWCLAYMYAIRVYMRRPDLQEKYKLSTIVYNTCLLQVKEEIRIHTAYACRNVMRTCNMLSLEFGLTEDDPECDLYNVIASPIDVESKVVNDIYALQVKQTITVQLTGKQNVILWLYVTDNLIQQDIATKIGVTRKYISKTLKDIRAKMQQLADRNKIQWQWVEGQITEKTFNCIQTEIEKEFRGSKDSNSTETVEELLYKHSDKLKSIALQNKRSIFEILDIARVWLNGARDNSTK